MLRFVQPDRRMEGDSVVVRHEFGHALAGFVLGFGIGRMAFGRLDGYVLAGSVRTDLVENSTAEREVDQAVITRLLAGEIAGRRYLGMRRKELCAAFDLSPYHHFSYVKAVSTGGVDDISKALLRSCKYKNEWFEFLSECHTRAETIVSADWLSIEVGSAKIEKKGLPKFPGLSLLITGLEIIRIFESNGSVPGSGVAIEAVHRELLGSPFIRITRAIRCRFSKSLHVRKDNFRSATFL